MGRAEFQYDEVGNTFYYVLLAFYALILLPATYFFAPFGGKEEEEKVDERQCQCNGCVDKRRRKAASQPYKTPIKIAKVVSLIVAWVILAVLIQKVSTIEDTHVEYDPYKILQLDPGAPTAQVKKAYHILSKKFHPDKGGDPEMFDRIAKAYQALTDDESRENWEKYGNPDGPTATTFGIALPKWLVSKEYGVWVLAFYGLIFMVILPVGVGMWWYNSIKYNVDKVLLDTTQLFGYFIRKTPRMEIHRALMVLGGAFEFNKEYNNEIILRQTDDSDLPRLIRHLPLLGENKKERPLCMPYSLKARILIHSHLSRLPLESEGLLFDQRFRFRYTLHRCLRLIEEMVSIAQQINYYTTTKIPMETIDNLLRLNPMLVQALWPKNSSLMQLPHMEDYNINYVRRQKVMTCADLANLEQEKRRQVLNSLNDVKYRDVLIVLSSMPRLHIETHFEVTGEDDAHEVTAGCLVTLKAGDEALRMTSYSDSEAEGEDNEEEKEDGSVPASPEDMQKKRKVWEKQPAAKKKGGAKKKGPKGAPKKAVVAAVAAPATPATPNTEDKKKDKEENEEKKRLVEDDGDVSTGSGDDDKDSDVEASGAGSPNDEDSDDDGWVAETKKPVLEAKSYETVPVHCPLYPGEKFEWWWLALTNSEKKGVRRLIAPVTACKTLVDTQTIDMRFPAPEHKGTYVLNLAVHSDSYMDCDYSLDIKLDVKEAKEVVLPKYEDTDDEDEEGGAACASSSDEYTEESDDE